MAPPLFGPVPATCPTAVVLPFPPIVDGCESDVTGSVPAAVVSGTTRAAGVVAVSVPVATRGGATPSVLADAGTPVVVVFAAGRLVEALPGILPSEVESIEGSADAFEGDTSRSDDAGGGEPASRTKSPGVAAAVGSLSGTLVVEVCTRSVQSPDTTCIALSRWPSTTRCSNSDRDRLLLLTAAGLVVSFA